MKLVIKLNSQFSRQFQPKRIRGVGSIVNFIVGWKIEASHFIVVTFGNHTSSLHYSKITHWKARVGWHLDVLETKSRNTKGWQVLSQLPILWWVERLRLPFFVVAALGNQVAHIIPKWPVERPGLALGGIRNKMKEWKNGIILSEVLKSVDLCLDHLEREPVVL